MKFETKYVCMYQATAKLQHNSPCTQLLLRWSSYLIPSTRAVISLKDMKIKKQGRSQEVAFYSRLMTESAIMAIQVNLLSILSALLGVGTKLT